MEAVGAFRIFERSLIKRDLQYTEYYGDGDSKGFLQVKDIYGANSVTKLECIGHIQKRVGSRLRKLKKNPKGLGGKGKLTDKFIDKLQNYSGIAIRSNRESTIFFYTYKNWKQRQLDEIEITLSESRFCTVEEAELRCPQGIRLFNTNNFVNEYNNKILNAYTDRITSTAKDVSIGCTSKEQETCVRQKLHKMSLIDPNGLPYQTVYVNNIYYMITTNIDVTDGLANGAVGKLVYVETNYEGLVKTI
ncbi:uncharacterized protein TNCV_2028741 [Trichonephila clavipes]|nr:uncharacterized protein TNCV_2028741 [Trichonephila clavipes]